MKHLILSLLVSSCFLAGCSSNTATKGRGDTAKTGRDAGASSLDFSAFDAAVTQFLADNHLEGAGAVVVQKDRGIVHESGYGAFDKDRLYLIASSSKVMSVGVIMRLVDQGLIDLDKPISTYLSAWGNFKTDITVAEMLSNSSGMKSLTDDPLYSKYLCQYLYQGGLSNVSAPPPAESCGETIYTADDTADRIPPDTEFHYGGGQWQLAGGIAEVVSGKKWSDLIAETYGTPCGVPSIGYSNQYELAFAGDGGVAAALSYPPFFKGDVNNLPATDNPSIEGGAYTNIHDYGKILLMHLRGGVCDANRVLSAASVARMQVDRIGEAYHGSTIDPTLQGYGLGWWVDRVHPGVVADAGAYGAMPWIDNPRGYAAFVVLESTATVGTQLRLEVKPLLDVVFDAPGTGDAG